MKILIADKFSKEHLSLLGETAEVRYAPDLKAEELPKEIGDHQILVVRSTRVTREAVESAHSLDLIVRAGAGVNTIEVEAASKRGIFVANCPGKNSAAVAELTLGLILAIDRRLPENNEDLRRGKWNKSEYGKGAGLLGRTLGIIGTGSIGQEVAHRAKAFGMKVLAWSRSLTPEKAEELGVHPCAHLDELAQKSDIVSLHLALTPQTREIINGKFFEAMKPGGIFINAARAELVDTDALINAIQEKKIRAGLDVFPDEPAGGTGTFDHPLLKLPGVYGTHHIGASTDQAQRAIADEAVRIIQKFIKAGEVDNCVNLSQNTPASHQLVIRHFDKVGVLASVLDLLRNQGVNVEEMENTIFQGKEAACARLRLSAKPNTDALHLMESIPDILNVELLPL